MDELVNCTVYELYLIETERVRERIRILTTTLKLQICDKYLKFGEHIVSNPVHK